MYAQLSVAFEALELDLQWGRLLSWFFFCLFFEGYRLGDLVKTVWFWVNFFDINEVWWGLGGNNHPIMEGLLSQLWNPEDLRGYHQRNRRKHQEVRWCHQSHISISSISRAHPYKPERSYAGWTPFSRHDLPKFPRRTTGNKSGVTLVTDSNKQTLLPHFLHPDLNRGALLPNEGSWDWGQVSCHPEGQRSKVLKG